MEEDSNLSSVSIYVIRQYLYPQQVPNPPILSINLIFLIKSNVFQFVRTRSMSRMQRSSEDANDILRVPVRTNGCNPKSVCLDTVDPISPTLVTCGLTGDGETPTQG